MRYWYDLTHYLIKIKVNCLKLINYTYVELE